MAHDLTEVARTHARSHGATTGGYVRGRLRLTETRQRRVRTVMRSPH